MLDQLVAFDGTVCIEANLADSCIGDASGCSW